ncbi:hypothetical protein B296_00049615 [Ensete ventricosum]|uniref:Uncharacterized protein n=1 Tax=Ensete ventricosum TaxID=4639 RepID=A0A426XJL6_ENSVE|nr:hypothetical protein B296_00049615 [Ensete ventricosum]
MPGPLKLVLGSTSNEASKGLVSSFRKREKDLLCQKGLKTKGDTSSLRCSLGGSKRVYLRRSPLSLVPE